MAKGWRQAALLRLAGEEFDLLVVGGGATGAAIARDAATRGLRTALCERGDFACQTSSASSKLIHGGLRYLQNGDFGLVFEALAERRRLLTTAPHLCRPVEFVYPAYRGRSPSRALLALGVGLYDALALWRPPVRSSRLSSSALYSTLPCLRSAGLLGAQSYVDCQTDDARMVLENVLDARDAGAVVASYVEIENAPARRPVRVVNALDRLGGERFAIQARLVVNAVGPFCDSFGLGPRRLRPTKGVHIIVDAERVQLGGRAVVLHSPRDARLMFALPAGRRVLIGTTDTDWRARDQAARPPHPSDPIRASGEDVDYLLEAANHAFPPARLQRDDVIGTIAGLRPLIASSAGTPSATSREHEIWLDPGGVLTVAGGKLTTMRLMAEQALDRAVDLLSDRGRSEAVGPCRTRTRPLPGAGEARLATSLPDDIQMHLLRAYGSRAGQVEALIDADGTLARRLDPELPYIAAELVFGIRFDLACEVEDLLRRRTPLLIESRGHGLDVAPEAARLLARETGLSAQQEAAILTRYAEAVRTADIWRGDQSLPD